MTTRRFTQIGITLCAAIVAGLFTTQANAAAQMEIWKDPSATPDQRAHDLLGKLTLEEKISLVHADTTFTTPGVPRLGIPKFWMSDGPQGVREEIQSGTWGSANHTDDFATAMPADIGLAATFDPALGKAFGNVIGEEAKTRGKNVMLCPGLNIMRTPLNGRNSEYLGEDPFLTSRMAVGFIQGVQSHGVAACAKHFALNNQEIDRGSINVTVDERTMREIYLPAFKAAVTEARVWTVMTAYNRVNGQYCSENEFLLSQVLEKEWGFTGMVMTDWGGCHSTVAAANNGLDLEMGSNVGGDHKNDFFNTPLIDAINTGTVPAAKLDEMVLRNLRVMAATGSFDSPGDAAKNVPLMAPAHIEATRKIAESACVLLKNDRQVLPLDPTKVKTIAIIGANAKAQFAHQGNSATIKTRYEVTPLEGITNRAGDSIKISFSDGYIFSKPKGGKLGLGGAVTTTNPQQAVATNQQMIAAAVEAAKSADVAIVVAGLYRSQDQEGADRPNMNLPAGQTDLIAAVTKANPKTIVILTGGSPSNVEPWLDDAAGLMMYWYGGTEGGNALARVLFGDVNPSGHLPCSWPKQLTDSPAHANHEAQQYPGVAISWHGDARKLTPGTGPQETYSEGIFVGYRWYDAKNIEPLFPFGFGLSYTSFDFADLKPADPTLDDKSLVTVQATVTNTGPREGATVVQVYVSEDHTTVQRPPKELKGFVKLNLKPGEKAVATIKLDRSAFAHFDTDQHCWVADAGDYTIFAGDSSRHLPMKMTFNLAKAITFAEGN